MKGGIIIIDKNHRKAAKQLVAILLADLQPIRSKFIITVGGDSGAGKSAIASAIADELDKRNFNCFIFHQDDYKVNPPKTNTAKRAKNRCSVFINRDENDKREKILTIQHEIISKQKGLADILITKEFDAVML